MSKCLPLMLFFWFCFFCVPLTPTTTTITTTINNATITEPETTNLNQATKSKCGSVLLALNQRGGGMQLSWNTILAPINIWWIGEKARANTFVLHLMWSPGHGKRNAPLFVYVTPTTTTNITTTMPTNTTSTTTTKSCALLIFVVFV